jgi:hypothetical protein
LRDLGIGRDITKNRAGGIAGDQMNQCEDQCCDAKENRYREQKPTHQISQHAVIVPAACLLCKAAGGSGSRGR